ncbi:hypothetical protein Thimo_0663 [Thioflavicoccus mobilis 8321]|uniref:Uncharacterized protein n=1 Tax=Thioflavicoccus mobilis 8321 TaxID=765912 RepID=L0GRY8_9GAMM|nr:hypothetical protein Thimo_0663 [Thioflavicoccus mobilis 8321]
MTAHKTNAQGNYRSTRGRDPHGTPAAPKDEGTAIVTIFLTQSLIDVETRRKRMVPLAPGEGAVASWGNQCNDLSHTKDCALERPVKAKGIATVPGQAPALPAFWFPL